MFIVFSSDDRQIIFNDKMFNIFTTIFSVKKTLVNRFIENKKYVVGMFSSNDTKISKGYDLLNNYPDDIEVNLIQDNLETSSNVIKTIDALDFPQASKI